MKSRGKRENDNTRRAGGSEPDARGPRAHGGRRGARAHERWRALVRRTGAGERWRDASAHERDEVATRLVRPLRDHVRPFADSTLSSPRPLWAVAVAPCGPARDAPACNAPTAASSARGRGLTMSRAATRARSVARPCASLRRSSAARGPLSPAPLSFASPRRGRFVAFFPPPHARPFLSLSPPLLGPSQTSNLLRASPLPRRAKPQQSKEDPPAGACMCLFFWGGGGDGCTLSRWVVRAPFGGLWIFWADCGPWLRVFSRVPRWWGV